MKFFRKLALFLIAIFLFIIIVFAGMLYLNFSGLSLFCFIIFSILIGIMVNAIRGWIKRKHHWARNVERLLFGVIGIAALYLALAVNHSLESQIRLLSESPLSPSFKVNLLSYQYLGRPVVNVDYESVTENGITFNYPKEEKNYQVLIDHTINVIGQQEKVFEDYFGIRENMELSITFSQMLNDNDRVERGFYNSAEKHIYLQNPVESMGWTIWDQTLVHEYSHFLFDMAVQEKGLLTINFPQWFNEGIASYIPKKPVVEENLKDKEWVPYNELAYDESWNEKRLDSRYAPYFQAYKYIEKLVELKGPDIILDIIDKNAQYNSFEEAFHIVVGKTSEDFGDGVIQDIEQMVSEN